MRILLGPSHNGHAELTRSYRRAIKSSKELYIATAFLTNWATRDRLSPSCHKFLFLVGTDFGLTRKLACENVLTWLPRKFKSDFLAVPSSHEGSFHPKVIAWKGLDNRFYTIIGSSNLTEAAFNSNIEANVELELSGKEYERIVRWIEEIGKGCQVINDDWLSQYKERNYSRPKGESSHKAGRVIQLQIPAGKKYDNAIFERRRQQRKFKDIHGKLIAAMKQCANGSISNSQFWQRFWNLWAHHDSRIQGSGLQFSAKSANWRQACKSMLRILERAKLDSEVNLDRIVRQEIDMLSRAGNPVRGAWMSEMLCHYMPDRYPLLNQPVNDWLKLKRWKAQRGSSEGSAYIELARKLREVVRQNKDGPRNLAELDAVIWLSVNS